MLFWSKSIDQIILLLNEITTTMETAQVTFSYSLFADITIPALQQSC